MFLSVCLSRPVTCALHIGLCVSLSFCLSILRPTFTGAHFQLLERLFLYTFICKICSDDVPWAQSCRGPAWMCERTRSPLYLSQALSPGLSVFLRPLPAFLSLQLHEVWVCSMCCMCVSHVRV